jgi:hypothetical protein
MSKITKYLSGRLQATTLALSGSTLVVQGTVKKNNANYKDRERMIYMSSHLSIQLPLTGQTVNEFDEQKIQISVRNCRAAIVGSRMHLYTYKK